MGRYLMDSAILEGQRIHRKFSKKFKEIEKKLGYDLSFQEGLTAYDVTILEGSGFSIDELESLVSRLENQEDIALFRQKVFDYIADHHVVSPITLRWWSIPDFRNMMFDRIGKHHLEEDKDLFLKWFEEDQKRWYPRLGSDEFNTVCNRLGIPEANRAIYMDHWKRDMVIGKQSKLKGFIESTIEEAIVRKDPTLLARDPFWKMVHSAAHENEELVDNFDYIQRTSFIFRVFYMRFDDWLSNGVP